MVPFETPSHPNKTMRSPVVEYHGPYSPPALELFACSRLKLGDGVHGRAETIPFLNVLPLRLVERVVHVGGRQDHLQHFPAPRVLRTPYSLEVRELRESAGCPQETANESHTERNGKPTCHAGSRHAYLVRSYMYNYTVIQASMFLR